MKKILVLVANYPNNDGGVSLMYVHVRNKYYMQHGIEVVVLNFSAKSDYVMDGIKVISLKSYKNDNTKYDVLVLHAANIRNHYKFLKKYDQKFSRLLFFFHGHEVLKINEVYPKPYDYVRENGVIRRVLQNGYDNLKLRIWRKYFREIADQADFVFVSSWLFREFQHYVRLTEADLKGHVHIIHNSVGSVFEENTYKYKEEKKYDFITIRSYMDDAKYCIDLVDQFAKNYPQYRFVIIGKGNYYKVHEVPENVTWIDRFLSHQELMDYIDQSRCGILLTREDTQGVMTCELSVYGIPMITSDIDVCREICSDIKNIRMVSNQIETVNLKEVFEELLLGIPYAKSSKFSYKNTVQLEEELIKKLK